MRKDLLYDWVDALQALDKTDWQCAGWNMRIWANSPPKSPLLNCGTKCCAYGVGSTLPSWEAAGLKLIQRGSSWRPTCYAYKILGISQESWHWITQPDYYTSEYISPSDVSDRILMIIDKATMRVKNG